MTRNRMKLRYKPTEQERHPLIGYSKASTLFKLAIFLFTGAMLVYLSFGWSLNETEKMTNYALGGDYGWGGAWLIQLLPQVLLIIRVLMINRTFRAILLGSALLVNGVDAATNVSAFLATPRIAPADWAPGIEVMALWVGIALAVGITWAEELLALLIGTSLHLMALLIAGSGRKPPDWMRVSEIVARGAAGSPSAQLYPDMMPSPATGTQRAPGHRAPGGIRTTAEARRAAYFSELQRGQRQ